MMAAATTGKQGSDTVQAISQEINNVTQTKILQ